MQYEPIIGQMHPRGEIGFYIRMFAQLVADMGKPGLGDPQVLNFRYRFGQRIMGQVFFMSQGIEHDLAAAFNFLFFTVVDAVGVGYIGKIAEAKTQHRHFHVPYLDGDDGDIADGEGVFIDPVQPEVRDTGIFDICKGVGELPDDHFLGHFVGVEVHSPVLEEIIGPYVVQAGQMILMGMGKDDCIQLADVGP